MIEFCNKHPTGDDYQSIFEDMWFQFSAFRVLISCIPPSTGIVHPLFRLATVNCDFILSGLDVRTFHRKSRWSSLTTMFISLEWCADCPNRLKSCLRKYTQLVARLECLLCCVLTFSTLCCRQSCLWLSNAQTKRVGRGVGLRGDVRSRPLGRDSQMVDRCYQIVNTVNEKGIEQGPGNMSWDGVGV